MNAKGSRRAGALAWIGGLWILSAAAAFGQISAESAATSSTADILTDADRRAFFEAARLAADWLVANQVSNPYDANCGRFLNTYNVKTRQGSITTSNWMISAAAMGLLMIHDRTGDPKYLDTALRAGQYLKDLQILDPRKPEYYGAIREDTAHSPWCHPRDAATAAWAMIWLYKQTGDEDYIDRVKLFFDWFFREGMPGDWPLFTYHFDGRPHVAMQGSFHGGDGLIFYDYFRVTGDTSYLAPGLKRICDYAMDKFITPDGRVRVLYDAEKKAHVEDGVTFDGMQKMHRHNDDFMTISLLDAWAVTGDAKYLERVEAYARWLISEQRPDGGFGRPDVPPAAATGTNLLLELHRVTGKPEYLRAAVKSARYLLTRQETDLKVKEALGGFYGYGDNWSSGQRETLNIRTSAYALIALLKMEGRVPGPYYSPYDREGNLSRSPEP